MWPEMVEILEIISVCLPLTLPPVTGALEPKLDSRLIGWQTYARCSQSSLPVQTARIHRQCRYAAEDNDPRNNDEPLLDAAFMDRCIHDPERCLANYGTCEIKQGAGCRVRTDKYRCEGIADERAWAKCMDESGPLPGGRRSPE
jgi:hypothetical protein